VERRSTRLVFVFDDNHSDPVLLAKLPGVMTETAEATEGLAAEQRVLGGLPADVTAPRPRGRVGPAWLQDVLPGRPLLPLVVHPRQAATASWPDSMRRATELLTRLGAATATTTEVRAAHELSLPAVHLPVSPACRDAVNSSLERVSELPTTVLRHGDTSPQNVLVDPSGQVGLVDWEGARRGLPGFDTWNLVQAVLEQGLALLTWDDRRLADAFRAAWRHSELMRRGREAARLAARAAGVPDALHDDLEVAFYARRLSRRLTGRPADYAVGPRLAAQMLETVCVR
jgi:hypothetical protein